MDSSGWLWRVNSVMSGLMSGPPISGHGHEHRDPALTIFTGIEVERYGPH